ncbi:MAG TPA: SAM-dependent methyltransferase [Actinomycetes bacterium]|nr:SAM-dependent methyltransferase [Actinomycetes bacterium]
MSNSHGIAGAGPEDAPPEINTNVAHPARVYDYWLGGKDNFPADRALAEHIMQAIPTMRAMAAANRDFLVRAVRYLAEQAGIRQFLDIGTGIPTSPNVHEVAQAVAPDARVVYVDNDPIVLAHARALLKSQAAGATAFILADLRQPRAILDHPTVQDTLDLSQPVALLMVAVLMYFRDSEEPNPYGMVTTMLERLPSGSYLAVSHPTAEFDAQAMAGAVAAAEQAGVTLVPRSQAETQALFTGLELVEPGVVPVLSWRPDGEPPADPHSAYYWAAVGRKP